MSRQPKAHTLLIAVYLTISCALAPSVLAEDAAPKKDEAKIVVFLPERIDTEWFWYHYTETAQHFVQGAAEKRLIRAGYDVIDLETAAAFQADRDIDALTSKTEALKIAKELGATHLVSGKATASMMSHDRAYGVNVYRSQADATAKIIRVEDGKVLATVEETAVAGSQSQKSAGRDALKSVGKTIGKKLERELGKLFR